ncbi:hypothetical protein BGZ50_008412 [Haplosporangium sp. Z 11]|nr:hypothetical protein BGZ50_008412 [Haplosporangium sp. Z 11]
MSNNGFTSYLQNPYYFMHASLVEKDTREDVLLIKDTRSKEDVHLFKDNRTKATTGSSVSSLYPLKDFEDNGTESGFFVFPDLSVRMEGVYRLKFCLYEMVGSDVHFCAHVISEPLIVYSAKKFPGMEESTLLSQYFAEQGLKIRIRKEVRPKKRSRGEYITAPTSASPTGSQHFDHADPFESQNEDETTTTAVQSTSVDTTTTSKRRASGTRAMDSRRVEASPAQHADITGHTSDKDRRPSHTLRSASWRGPTTEHTEHQTIVNASDRPRSAHESNPRQQDYFDDAAAAARRSSATSRAAEGVSHLDLNAGPRGLNSRRHDQCMEEYRLRTQDHVPGHERGLTATSPSSRQGPPASHFRASIGTRHTPIQSHLGEGRPQGQFASHSPTMPPIHYPSELPKDNASRLKSGAVQEYADESMRINNAGQHRELAQEMPYVYDARGGSNVPTQRHPRDPPHSPPYPSEQPPRAPYPHPQLFAAGSRLPELTFHHSSRQSMPNAADQMSMDYIPAVSHSGESHKPSVPSNSHELPDYRMRPGVASTSAPPFHPLSQTLQQQQQVQHEQQYQDHPGQGQIQDSTGPRRPSHHDNYAGHRQSFAPQPYTSPPGKFLVQEGQGPLPQYTIHSLPSSHAPHIADQASYSPQDGSVVVHGRYAAHGHASYPGVQAEPIGRPSREDQDLVRSQEYHAPPASRFPHVSTLPAPMSNVSSVHPSTDSSPPVGYPAHPRERQSSKGSVGFSVSAAAATAPGVSYPIVVSNGEHPTSMAPLYPPNTLSQDPSLGMVQRTGPRPGSTEQSPQGRPGHRHSRSYSSSSAPRPSYQPLSLSTSAAVMVPGQASNYGATLAVSKRASYHHGGEDTPGAYEGYEDGHGHQYATTHPVLRNAQDHASYETHGGRSYEQEPGYASAQGPPSSLAQQQPHQHQHQHQHHHQMQQQQLHQYQMHGAPLHPHHHHQHVSHHPPPHQQHPYQHYPRPPMQQHQHQHHPLPSHSSASQQHTIHAEQVHHSSVQHSLPQHHTHPYPPPH